MDSVQPCIGRNWYWVFPDRWNAWIIRKRNLWSGVDIGVPWWLCVGPMAMDASMDGLSTIGGEIDEREVRDG